MSTLHAAHFESLSDASKPPRGFRLVVARPRSLKRPKYTHFKPRNLARVRLPDGDHYLGTYGSLESCEKYEKLLAQWEAARECGVEMHTRDAADDNVLTVGEVIGQYLGHVRETYVDKSGKLTTEGKHIRNAMLPLLKLFAELPVTKFGPKALRRVRRELIETPYKWKIKNADGKVVEEERRYVRSSINARIGRIKLAFRWAAGDELVPPELIVGLDCVEELREGRTTAPESTPVMPVPVENAEALEPYLTRPLWGALRVQMHTGARASEVLQMRTCDIDRSSDVWLKSVEQPKLTAPPQRVPVQPHVDGFTVTTGKVQDGQFVKDPHVVVTGVRVPLDVVDNFRRTKSAEYSDWKDELRAEREQARERGRQQMRAMHRQREAGFLLRVAATSDVSANGFALHGLKMKSLSDESGRVRSDTTGKFLSRVSQGKPVAVCTTSTTTERRSHLKQLYRTDSVAGMPHRG